MNRRGTVTSWAWLAADFQSFPVEFRTDVKKLVTQSRTLSVLVKRYLFRVYDIRPGCVPERTFPNTEP